MTLQPNFCATRLQLIAAAEKKKSFEVIYITKVNLISAPELLRSLVAN